MTAQPGRPQAPFTSGELSPTLRERRDLKYYRSGAMKMQNVEVLPQGGFRHAGGSVLLARARRDLVPVPLSGATITAPAGGTAGQAVDGDAGSLLVSDPMTGAGPYTVLLIAFAAPTSVAAIDVTNIFCSAGNGSFAMQWNDGAAWHDVGFPLLLTTSSRTRRIAFPPGHPVAVQQWRLVVDQLTATCRVDLGDVNFLAETAGFGPMRLRPFMDKDGNETLHVWSAGHADVVGSAGWAASYPTPFPGAAVPFLKTFQQLDTMVAFHQDVYPRRVMRQGSDAEWQSEPAPLINLPSFDYGAGYSNGVAAVWQVSVIGAPEDATLHNVAFSITVNGEESPSLVMPLTAGAPPLPDWPAFAVVVQNALVALPGVEPGATVTYGGSGGGFQYLSFTFSGAGNEGDDWLLSMRSINKSDIACPAYRNNRGVKGGEPIISGARGYPRCGVFYQQSMLLGGLKSLPNAWMKSETGNYWNFDTATAAATGAMLVPMDSQGGEAIEEMVAGRTVMLLTSLGEYFLSNRTIAKTEAPNHVQSSRHGSSAGVPSVENEGAAIFAHPSGVLYEFRYDEVGQTFVARNLSIMASHLLGGVSDMAIRRAVAGNDAAMLYAVQPGEFMPCFALLREQDVTAGLRRVTDGRFLSVAALQGSNTVGVITARITAGQQQNYVERLDPAGLLDQATSFTFDPPRTHISGLEEYEGAVVWVIADDDVIGKYTVFSGALNGELPTAARNVTVGRWTPPYVETLPPDRSIGPGVVLERRARIHTVRISLVDTTSLAVGANGGKIYDVPLFRFGDAPDVPALQHKFTGVIRIQGLTGFADQPTVVITQKRPGYLNVRGITIEADL